MDLTEGQSFLYFLLISIITLHSSNSECSFPQKWQSSDWFTHYATAGKNIKKYVSADRITWDDIGDNLPAAEVICHSGKGNVKSYTYLMSFVLLPSVMVCIQETLASVAMLRRYNYILFDASKNADYCSTTFGKETSLEWHTEYPFNLKSGKTPFSQGVYQATYRESPGNEMCGNDAKSVIIVTENTLKIRTCYDGIPSFEKPFNVELTVLDDISGSVIDDVSYGDVMLLANASSSEEPLFYCSRYKSEKDKIYFSLNVQSTTAADCVVNRGFDASGDGYIAFTLSTDSTSTGDTTIAFGAATTGRNAVGMTTQGASAIEATTAGGTTISAPTASASTMGKTKVDANTVSITTKGARDAMTTSATSASATMAGATTSGANKLVVTSVAVTTEFNDRATNALATSGGSTISQVTTVGATTSGDTTLHATSTIETTVRATTLGATTQSLPTPEHTTMGLTSLAATTAALPTSESPIAARTSVVASILDTTSVASKPDFEKTSIATKNGQTSGVPTAALTTSAHTTEGKTTARATTAAQTSASPTPHLSTSAGETTLSDSTTENLKALSTTAKEAVTDTASPTPHLSTSAGATTLSDSTTENLKALSTTAKEAVTTVLLSTKVGTTQSDKNEGRTSASTRSVEGTTIAKAIETTSSAATTGRITTVVDKTTVKATTVAATTIAGTTTAQSKVQSTTATVTERKGPAVTTAESGATTAAAEGKQHVQLKSNDDYDSTIGNEKDAAEAQLKGQLTSQIGAGKDQIQNVITSPGSIFIDFDVVPDPSGSPTVDSIINSLKIFIPNNALILTSPSGITLSLDKDYCLITKILDGGPCSSSPCLNGGACTNTLENTYLCSCLPIYSGDRCETDNVLPPPGLDQTLLISLTIGLAVTLLLVVCVCAVAITKSKPPQMSARLKDQLSYASSPRDEEGIIYARSWHASYISDKDIYHTLASQKL